MSLSISKGWRPATARRTREREWIFDCVETMRGHFSAEQLLFALHRRVRRVPRVSRATVYRTLDLLVDRGVVQRIPVDQGGFLYERTRGPGQHAHLYCLRCGKLMDYPMAYLRGIPGRVRRKSGFRAEHLLLRVCGYCRDCWNRTRKKRK